ncbi:hypothetical protein KOR42_03150 [Thalassoglobus neptunius]|uniref:Uncharacterized protein n=1 Tax=Thalassoglobus neptunius TaxID=1938619 RepID=A0A5C5X2X6_9PLAN|nr:hypothetical protein [Thalassoglobus neptunius]TWT56959.1 hypothetical protein KOR42_03150 [Thalassoglobus neptunius]
MSFQFFHDASRSMIRPLKLRFNNLAMMMLGVLVASSLSQSLFAQPDSKSNFTGQQLDEIKRIYVPQEELSSILRHDKQGVVMSEDEFEELVKSAKEDNQFDESAPRGHVVSNADYSVQIDEHRLVGEVVITLRTFDRKWMESRLNITGWNIEKATIDDGPATIARDGDQQNTLRVFVDEPGEHVLKLSVSSPLQSAGSDQAVKVSLVEASSGVFQLSLPAGIRLELDQSSVDRPTSLEEPATYSIPIGGQQELSMTITDRQKETRGEVLTFANTAMAIRLFPSELSWSAQTELQVFGQEIEKLVCSVPNTLEITGIDSNGLESWELSDDPDDASQTRITLNYRQGISSRRTLNFRGIQSFQPSQPWTAPTLKISGLTSHSGSVTVDYPSSLRLQVLQAAGVRAAEAEALPSPPVNGEISRVEYLVWDESFTLQFLTNLKQQEVQAAMTNVLDVGTSELKLFTSVSLETKVVPLFDVRLLIPSDWEVEMVQVNGADSDWNTVSNQAGINEIRIPLATPLAPGETRDVLMQSRRVPDGWPLRTQLQRISIPEIRLPQAAMVEALYGMTASDELTLTPQDVTGLDPAGQSDLQVLNEKVAVLNKSVKLGFTYQDTTFEGELEIERKPKNVTVETLTFFRVDDEQIFTRLEAVLLLSGGGVQELTIQVSESAGDSLRFSLAPDIKIQRQQQAVFPNAGRLVEQIPGEVADGFRTWTLRFDRFLKGQYRLSTDVILPRDSEVTPFQPAQMLFPDFSIVSGHVAVEGGLEEFVRVEAVDQAGQPLVVVDPVDFPAALYHPDERVIAGFQYVHPGWNLTVTQDEFERSAVPTVVGHVAQLESVISKAGQFQHQVTWTFTAVGAQSLVVVPQTGAELWSMLIDGVPVEVRRSRHGVEVPVSNLDPLKKHQLRVLYSTNSQSLATIGELSAVAPTIAVLDGSGELQPVEILKQDWVLHLPHETMVIGSEGDFLPKEQIAQAGLFHEFRSLLRLPRASDAVGKGIALLVTGLILLLIGWWRVRWQRHSAKKEPAGFSMWRTLVLLGVLICVISPLLYFSLLSRPAREASVASTYFATSDAEFIEPSAAEGIVQFESEEAEAEMKAGQPASGGAEFGRDNLLGLSDMDMDGAEQMFDYAGGYRQNDFVQPQGLPPTAPPSDQPVPATIIQQPNQSLAVQAIPEEESASQSNFGEAEVRERSRARAQRGRFSTGGLLSMTFQLEVPEDSRTERFTYQGNGTAASDVDLRVRFANRTTGRVLVWSVALGIALLGWWLRRTQPATRAFWIFLTLVVPVALIEVVPMLWELLLEGVVWGGLLSMAGWVLRGIVQWCWNLRVPLTKQAAGLIVAAAVVFAGNSTFAQDGATVASEQSGPAVIIPYSDISDVKNADRVFVSHALYKQLWESANAPNAVSEDGPIDSTVSEATYFATLNDSGDDPKISIQARWVVSVLTDQPILVKLPIQGVAISSISIDGEPAPVLAGWDQSTEVRLLGRGIHIVDGTLVSPAAVNGLVGQFQLKLSPVGAANLIFELPEAEGETRVQVDGQQRSYRRTTEDDKTRIEIACDRGGTRSITWFPESQIDGQDRTVQVETAIAASFRDVGFDVSHSFRVRVRQGTLNEISFSLPEGVAVRDVGGNDLGGWDMIDATDDEGAQLRVFFRRGITADTNLFVDLFKKQEVDESGTTVTLPTLAPLGVLRETVQLAVFVPDHLKVRVDSVEGLLQTDVSRFSPVVAPRETSGTLQLAYRTSVRPFDLQLTIRRQEADSKTTIEYGVHIARRRTLVATRIVWTLTGAPQRRLDIEIPEDYLPMSVICAESSDWYVHQSNGRRMLTIEFPQPRVGTVEAGIEGHLPKSPGQTRLEVLLPRPAGINSQSATLGIWLDEGYQASMAQPGGWRSIRPGELSGSYRNLDPDPVQFAFSTMVTNPENVILQIRAATAKLTGDSVTLIAVGEATIDYGMTLRWNISQAAADQFVFTTPSWLQNVEMNGPTIRQITSEELEDGRTRWTVSLIDPVIDQYMLTIVATNPHPDDLIVRTPRIVFESLKPGGEYERLTVQQQFAFLVNLSHDQLVAEDLDQFELVPAGRLPFRIHDNLLKQAVEITQVRDDKIPTWKIQRMDGTGAAKAVVLGAHLETVLELDRSWRMQANYAVRNRGRQFLALDIPEGSRILSVFVRNKPSRTVTTDLDGRTIHLIALPQTSAVDLAFDVRVLLAGRLPGTNADDFDVMGESLSLPAPKVLSQKESEEFGMPVTQTLWTVHLPDELKARVMSAVKDTNLTPHAEDAWLAAEKQTLDRLQADISEMSRIVSDQQVSRSRRVQAQNNLKTLSLTLEQVNDNYLANSSSGSDQVELLEELIRDNQFLQKEVEKASQGDISVTPLDAGFGNNRDFIIVNNGELLANNSANGIVFSDESKTQNFNFLQIEGEELNRKKFDDTAQESASRSRLKSRLSSQQLIVSGSGRMSGMGLASPGSSEESQPRGGGVGGGGFGVSGLTDNLQSEIELQQQDAQRHYQDALGRTRRYDLGYAGGESVQQQPSDSLTFDTNSLSAFGAIAEEAPGQFGDASGLAVPAATQPWTSVGGLSVEMGLPKHRQTISFSKPGGSPVLTLSVQPAESNRFLWGVGWCFGVLIFGMWLFKKVRDAIADDRATQFLSSLAMILGALALLFLPGDFEAVGFIMFVVAGIVKIVVWRPAATQSPTA